ALLTPTIRRYFGDARESYSLYIAGTRIYICSSPEGVASLLGNTTTVANQNIINLIRWIGVSEESVTRFFQIDTAAKHNTGMGKPQAPASMMDEFHRRQLKSGERVEKLFHEGLLPEVDQILQGILEDGAKSVDGTSMSLLSICSDMFIGGTITAFLGDQVRESRPALVDSFVIWERTCWKWAFQMPAVLSRDMLQARDGMVAAFVDYLDIPADDRQDAAYFTKATEAMLRDVGICNNEDIARIFVVQFFNILSNVYKAAFWTIAYMVYEPSLIGSIRSEIAPAVQNGQVQDESFLSKSCPLLDALMSETFRLTVASSLGRDVIGPTPVGGKILQPGSVLMLPVHQLHFDPSVWGPNARAMDLGRLARDPKLYASRSYRPFGGGHSLCPARFFVKRAIGYAVASLVAKFDVHVDIERTRQKVGTRPSSRKQGQSVREAGGIDSINFPRVDLSKPSPGASLPVVQGEDVYVVLKQRSR
ncbi:hypothetical protein PG999_012315, partial [Apiospora kogelbergensis]